mmetsp:Transcript_32885/g.76580  ORF Transcript_32885/g.76580 Transcript_32885/m.76580 type:complete len:229 (-) Transcript_32885:945-1631(-)
MADCGNQKRSCTVPPHTTHHASGGPHARKAPSRPRTDQPQAYSLYFLDFASLPCCCFLRFLVCSSKTSETSSFPAFWASIVSWYLSASIWASIPSSSDASIVTSTPAVDWFLMMLTAFLPLAAAAAPDGSWRLYLNDDPMTSPAPTLTSSCAMTLYSDWSLRSENSPSCDSGVSVPPTDPLRSSIDSIPDWVAGVSRPDVTDEMPLCMSSSSTSSSSSSSLLESSPTC